ncbi:PA1571 family protein [Pseudomonas sp.]|uniref:PA1571 family protein n=1 Tax=Pseudomonas sp. TaxID=306 RepID=UPI00272C7344|nr:PA1571 family protein [Pseudomonas sp.]
MSPAYSRQQRDTTHHSFDSNFETAGFLIDENGQEIAITEQMIQQACADLERQWRPARSRVSAAR